MHARTFYKDRKTIRGFLDKEVPKKTILEVLTDAHWAPSSSNQQPWHFHVVRGSNLKNLCSAIRSAHQARKKSYDPSRGKTVPAVLVERTRTLFKEMRPFLNRLGEENRSFIESGSFRFYDAPVVIFITLHTALPGSRLMDIGMAAENLMLSAHDKGLGTCAIALTLLYADVINRELKVPDSTETVLSVALGYPDTTCSINEFRSSREDISKVVSWHGFDT